MTKILLVEDDKSLREIYGVRLLAEGYDIVSAGDGEEALAMAIKERPQLIVSDVMMPKISGFDMLDILRSTTETKDIKVIIMTALSSEDQRSRGEQLGADRYLVKSQVGIEDVVRTVHEVLADAPVTSATGQQMFASPTPRPPVAPQPFAGPSPTPVVTPPRFGSQVPPRQQPVVATAPAAQPQVSPVSAPATPVRPAPTPVSTMPQPTAPFSSQRPANLGDRIIHPISQPETSEPDVATLMSQALNDASLTPATDQPADDNSTYQPQDSVTPLPPVQPFESQAPTEQPHGAVEFNAPQPTPVESQPNQPDQTNQPIV